MPPPVAAASPAAPQIVTIGVDDTTRVSGLLLRPALSKWCFVLAHGAGAGMRHPFMVAVADGLAALGIATLRYQFPFAERQTKRPDVPALCHATVRAAVAAACRRAGRQAGSGACHSIFAASFAPEAGRIVSGTA